MTRQRTVFAGLALIGAFLGALLGYMVAPNSHRYSTTANVALLPAADLSTNEASGFWEVLTRGQISRMAAIVYNDHRWLPSAAKAAKVPQGQLSLTAAAVPDTTMVTVTVQADSPTAAEIALNNVLTVASTEVTSLIVPFAVKVLWPPQDSAVPVPQPGGVQVAAAGALGGLLVGGGIGWQLRRRVRRSDPVSDIDAGIAEEVPSRP